MFTANAQFLATVRRNFRGAGPLANFHITVVKEPFNGERRFQSMAELKQALQGGAAATRLQAAVATLLQPQEAFVDPYINSQLSGGYRITDFIGQGGMSMVYRAVQEGSGRVVAVKMLKEELSKDDMYIKRFNREVTSLSRMTHDGFVSVFDMGTSQQGQPYMVIEYLQGHSLHDWIIENGRMSPRQMLPIFTQVCDVMVYAHTQGIIHRDIKPHNIMLIKQGRREDVVKVVDFGIIKLDENIVNVSQKLTAAGEICGSPMYMSPEQILDEPLDGRTDIYSLGIAMYEVLCGKPLFGGTKITEVMNKHINVRARPLNQVVTDGTIPARLDAAVCKCLEKSRNNRFQAMSDLKDELTKIMANLDTLLTEAAELKARGGKLTAVPPEVAITDGAHQLNAQPKQYRSIAATDVRHKRDLIACLAILLVAAVAAVVIFVFKQHNSGIAHAPYRGLPEQR
jgi:serine/threonine protein kinase